MVKTSKLIYSFTDSKQLSFPDLTVESGKTLIIGGESGCGKTTLLHLLAGLRRPKNGTILFNNQDISRFSSRGMDKFRGQHIGLVYQQSYFIQSLSILDNLLLSPFAKSVKKANMVAKRLQIDDLLDRYPDQLSGGEKQRVTIARAVMNQPKLMLADEPTSSLDNKNCSKVIHLLKEEAVANNAALIVVTHDTRVIKEGDLYIDLDEIKEL